MKVKLSIVSAGLAAAAVSALVLAAATLRLSADSLNCNLSQYKPAQGLTAAIDQDGLVVSWAGQNGADLRARYAIDSGQPVVRDLAVKKAGGQWTTLGRNLAPEYHVVTGIRRMADDQANPLKAAGIELTEEVINKNRWYAFWDAPLVMPGSQEMQDEAAWRRSQQLQQGRGEGRGGRGQAQAAAVGLGHDETVLRLHARQRLVDDAAELVTLRMTAGITPGDARREIGRESLQACVVFVRNPLFAGPGRRVHPQQVRALVNGELKVAVKYPERQAGERHDEARAVGLHSARRRVERRVGAPNFGRRARGAERPIRDE